MKTKDMYCEECNRFLLKMAYGIITIKCPNSKCKHENTLKLIDQSELSKLTLVLEDRIMKA